MTKRTGTMVVALAALWIGGADVAAQEARTVAATRVANTRDIKLSLSSADFTANPAAYTYKKWSMVEATVCNAAIGGNDKNHATLFINLAQKGSTTPCDPYTSPTVYTSVNRNMTDPSQFVSSMIGAKIRFSGDYNGNSIVFKIDKKRSSRYIAYVNIDKNPSAIEVMQGGNYTALKIVKADIGRTDFGIVEERKRLEEVKAAERERAEEARGVTSTTTSTSTVNNRGTTSNGQEGGFNFFNWFMGLFRE